MIVTVDVPDVVGQTQATTTALTNADLSVGTITTQDGATVDESSAVNLVISSGNPLLVTMSEDSPGALPGDEVCATNTNGCTLRAAIQEPNALNGEQTITIEPGTYTLTLAGANEDDAATGGLDITDDVIVESSSGNATEVVIAANALDRVFDLPPGSDPRVTFRGLTIQGGMVVGSTGGGLRNAQGTLTIEDPLITANQSNGSGGGISHLGGALTLLNTMLTGNMSQGLGGGLQAQGGSVTIDGNSQFRGNSANFGGGLSVDRANVTVTDTQVENNTAIGVGGAFTSSSVPVISSAATLPSKYDCRTPPSATICPITVKEITSAVANNPFGNTDQCNLPRSISRTQGSLDERMDPRQRMSEMPYKGSNSY